jgi:low temperature requirement protein LtrA
MPTRQGFAVRPNEEVLVPTWIGGANLGVRSLDEQPKALLGPVVKIDPRDQPLAGGLAEIDELARRPQHIRGIDVMRLELIERLGLFVIIVLGEVIVGAVDGMAELEPLDKDGIVLGLLGVLVPIGLWWIYFDLVSDRAPISRRTQLWLYLHLPLVIAMAAGGAGVLNTVEHASEALPDAVRWLLVSSLAAAVLSIALITRTLEARRAQGELYRSAEAAMLISILLSLGVGLTDWGAKASLMSMVVLLLAPVATGHDRVAETHRIEYRRFQLTAGARAHAR